VDFGSGQCGEGGLIFEACSRSSPGRLAGSMPPGGRDAWPATSPPKNLYEWRNGGLLEWRTRQDLFAEAERIAAVPPGRKCLRGRPEACPALRAGIKLRNRKAPGRPATPWPGAGPPVGRRPPWRPIVNPAGVGKHAGGKGLGDGHAGEECGVGKSGG